MVFTTRLGDPVDPRNFHRDFKLRAAKACVPVVPIYSTRRTCASLLVALDVHPRGRDVDWLRSGRRGNASSP